jgi:predicted nucleotidyltransferase
MSLPAKLTTSSLSALPPLCRANHITHLWLFGSALRPDFRPDSDLDILVEFEPGAHVGLLALGRLQRELARLFGRHVDLVPMLGLKPIVRAAVMTTRELLYAV